MYFHKKFHLYVKGIPFSRFFVSFPTFSASFTFGVPTFFPFLFIPVLKMKHCKHDLSFYLLGHNSNVYFVPNHCQNVHRANLIHAEVISEKRITRIILTNDVSWGCEIENVGIQIDVTYLNPICVVRIVVWDDVTTITETKGAITNLQPFHPLLFPLGC